MELSHVAAWRNSLLVTAAGCLLLGFGCFVFLGHILPRHYVPFQAAVIQQLGFAVCLGLITGGIVLVQRRRGESLRELGLGWRPRALASVLAVLLGVLYLAGSYFGAIHLLSDEDVLDWNITRLMLVPVGLFMAFAEELMMRGFFMTELSRARIATWVQILASGACSAVYHALHHPTLEGFVPSFLLFSLHAALYVLGGRSLWPPIVAHSLYHVFGEPYLIMLAMRAAR